MKKIDLFNKEQSKVELNFPRKKKLGRKLAKSMTIEAEGSRKYQPIVRLNGDSLGEMVQAMEVDDSELGKGESKENCYAKRVLAKRKFLPRSQGVKMELNIPKVGKRKRGTDEGEWSSEYSSGSLETKEFRRSSTSRIMTKLEFGEDSSQEPSDYLKESSDSSSFYCDSSVDSFSLFHMTPRLERSMSLPTDFILSSVSSSLSDEVTKVPERKRVKLNEKYDKRDWRRRSSPFLRSDFTNQRSLNIQCFIEKCRYHIDSEIFLSFINDFDRAKEIIVFDCRYIYEYEGGHIIGAVHLPDRTELKILFHSINETVEPKIIVFYCEYSTERGPKAYDFMIDQDRKKHEDRYPYLKYPDVYILNGGFKEFFRKYPHFCVPEGYTKMKDSNYREECIYYAHLYNNHIK